MGEIFAVPSNAQRCISYSICVCPSLRLSVRHTNVKRYHRHFGYSPLTNIWRDKVNEHIRKGSPLARVLNETGLCPGGDFLTNKLP